MNRVSGLALELGDSKRSVATTLERWQGDDCVRRLWDGDDRLWSGDGESQWLGWLRAPEAERTQLPGYGDLARSVHAEGFQHALLLGMGGSSLCPEVLSLTQPPIPHAPVLRVLDSTLPDQIAAQEADLDLARTLCIVSSKSGGTVESKVLMQYFQKRIQEVVGDSRSGSHFIAITDPGSALEDYAERHGFRAIVHGEPDIGGRFSAISPFGLVPAAIMGVDLERFLERTRAMVEACGREVAPAENPGVVLGVALAELALTGRDKLTLVASPAVAAFGAWLEQLIAESTGKIGRGIVPIDGEDLAAATAYGKDRVFVYLRLRDSPSRSQDAAVTALAAAGIPVIRIEIEDARDLGPEFFRWEIATAVAGSLLGVNPFDQPDVESAKQATRALTAAFEEQGSLPSQSPLAEDGTLQVFGAAPDSRCAAGLGAEELIRDHLAKIVPGDYFAINAFLERNESIHTDLQSLRHAVRNTRRVATTLGYGPRFLHSTGQLHKGGANRGVFLELTAEHGRDLPIPGGKMSFGVLADAQAQGDFEVLQARGRRVLRVHLGSDVARGLDRLRAAVL